MEALELREVRPSLGAQIRQFGLRCSHRKYEDL